MQAPAARGCDDLGRRGSARGQDGDSAGPKRGRTLTLAFAVNAAILSLAHGAHHGTREGLSALNAGLGSTFGPFATVVSGLTLLASGLASSMTGAIISVDVLAPLVPRLELPAMARRAVFLVPAAVIAASPLSPLSVLVWSQLVLTWTLPVALIPLVYFAGRSDLMGAHVLRRAHPIVAASVTATILAAGLWAVLAG